MGKRLVVFPELEAAMARRGDKQGDVADFLGLSVSQVSRRLSGRVEFNDGEIRRLCERYEQQYETLFAKGGGVSAFNGEGSFGDIKDKRNVRT